MHHSLLKQVGIAIAAFVVVAAASAAVWFLRDTGALSPSPADVLPANTVRGLFSVRGQEDLNRFAGWFGLSSSLPTTAEPSWVALVSGAKPGWLLFRPTPNGSAEPYLITASDPSLLGLLQQKGEKLGNDDAFVDVQPDADAPAWAYLAPAQTPRTLLGGWLKTPAAMSVSVSPDSVALQLRDAVHVGGKVYGVRTGKHDLSVAAGDWAGVAAQLRPHLGDEPALLGRTAMETVLDPLFGDALSPAYDLLPLLEDGGALHLDTGSGGTLQLLLTGSATSDAAAESILERVREGFAGAKGSVSRDRRTFEGEFAMDWLRADGGGIQERTERIGGWEITWQERDGLILGTGHAGKRIVVADSETGLRAALTEASTEDAVLGGGNTAAGEADLRTLNTLLQNWFGTNAPSLPFAQLFGGKRVQWSIDDDRRRILIEFRAL